DDQRGEFNGSPNRNRSQFAHGPPLDGQFATTKRARGDSGKEGDFSKVWVGIPPPFRPRRAARPSSRRNVPRSRPRGEHTCVWPYGTRYARYTGGGARTLDRGRTHVVAHGGRRDEPEELRGSQGGRTKPPAHV